MTSFLILVPAINQIQCHRQGGKCTTKGNLQDWQWDKLEALTQSSSSKRCPPFFSETRCKLSSTYREWAKPTQPWCDPKSKCKVCWHFQQCYWIPSHLRIDRATSLPILELVSAQRWAPKAPTGRHSMGPKEAAHLGDPPRALGSFYYISQSTLSTCNSQ